MTGICISAAQLLTLSKGYYFAAALKSMLQLL